MAKEYIDINKEFDLILSNIIKASSISMFYSDGCVLMPRNLNVYSLHPRIGHIGEKVILFKYQSKIVDFTSTQYIHKYHSNNI